MAGSDARTRGAAATAVVLAMVVVATLVAGGGWAGAVDGAGPLYAGAPWFKPSEPYDQNFPDPTVVWDGSTYWAYATTTGGPLLPAMSSTDLRSWTARPAYSPNPYNSDPTFNDAFPTPPTWSMGGSSNRGKPQWAPGVARIGSQWVAYTTWDVAPGRRCISAASSASPEGPFVDRSSSPVVCDADPGGSIDPSPYLDAQGRPYLLWRAEGGNGALGRVYTAPLSADGLSLRPGSTPTLMLVPVFDWEAGIVENPSMVYRGGAYWLLYSGGHWDSAGYRMAVARCDGPTGPCNRLSSAPLFGNTSTDLGPGAGSLFVDAAGRLRVAYHAWNAPYTSYPTNPNCDGANLCASQGQRFLHVEGLVAGGAAGLTVDPVGSLDSVVSRPRSVQVAGWAFDPSAPDTALQVHVYVDGTGTALAAGGPRADVGQAYPGYGASHGFSATVPAAPGQHTVCAYGINTGAGANRLLGCRSVTVPSGDPFGSLDGASGTLGGVSVAGWAIDPDTTGPIAVHVYVDGAGTALTANRSRPDVAAAVPGYGANHGFSATVAAAPGRHTVCAYGINTGGGGNSVLGCRAVTVPSGDPFGSLDVASGGAGRVSVAGWAIDPDTTGPIAVHVYVDAAGVALTASTARPDVGAAYPRYGANHGFSASVAAAPGRHTVCAYAINAGPGGNSLLRCQAVTVS